MSTKEETMSKEETPESVVDQDGCAPVGSRWQQMVLNPPVPFTVLGVRPTRPLVYDILKDDGMEGTATHGWLMSKCILLSDAESAEQAPMRFTSDGNTVINPDGKNPYEPTRPTPDLPAQVAALTERVVRLEAVRPLPLKQSALVELAAEADATAEPNIPRNWKRGTKETALRDKGGDFWGYYRIDANREWSELDYWDDKEFQPGEQYVYLIPDLHPDVVRDGWLPCEWEDAQGMGRLSWKQVKAYVMHNEAPDVGTASNEKAPGIFLRLDPNRKVVK